MSAEVMSQVSVLLFSSTCVLAQDCGRGLAAVFWSDWAVLTCDWQLEFNSTWQNKLHRNEPSLRCWNSTCILKCRWSFSHVFIVLLVFGVLTFQLNLKCSKVLNNFFDLCVIFRWQRRGFLRGICYSINHKRGRLWQRLFIFVIYFLSQMTFT